MQVNMIVQYVFMYLLTIIPSNVIHSSRGTIGNKSQYVNLWQVSVYNSETSRFTVIHICFRQRLVVHQETIH